MKPTSVQQRFINWITQRELARESKEMGVPYSGDPIIATCKFCNVNREHDAVTRWIAEHVRPQMVDWPLSKVVYELYLCRVFNEPTVLEHIVPGVTHKVVLKKLQSIKASGEKILRGAYLVVPHGTSMPVEVFYMNLASKVRDLTIWPGLLSKVADQLMSVKGISDFMANQVCADLRYQPGHSRWVDWDTFVLGGPGTRRGLARYAATGAPTRDTKGRIAKETGACAPLLLAIRDDLRHHLPDRVWQHFKDPNNLSNCFCEFDKYERARDGEASLRKYQPSTT